MLVLGWPFQLKCNVCLSLPKSATPDRGAMPLSVMTFSITTISKRANLPHSEYTTCINDTQHNTLPFIMLIVVILNVVMLSVIMQSVMGSQKGGYSSG